MSILYTLFIHKPLESSLRRKRISFLDSTTSLSDLSDSIKNPAMILSLSMNTRSGNIHYDPNILGTFIYLYSYNRTNHIKINKMALLITIAHRDVLEEKQTTTSQKSDAIKWLNEFQQRILNQIAIIHKGNLKGELKLFQKNVLFYFSII